MIYLTCGNYAAVCLHQQLESTPFPVEIARGQVIQLQLFCHLKAFTQHVPELLCLLPLGSGELEVLLINFHRFVNKGLQLHHSVYHNEGAAPPGLLVNNGHASTFLLYFLADLWRPQLHSQISDLSDHGSSLGRL